MSQRQYRANDQFLQYFPSIAKKNNEGGVEKTTTFRIDSLLKILMPIRYETKPSVRLIQESHIMFKLSFTTCLEFCIHHGLVKRDHHKYSITEKGIQLFDMFREDQK